MQFDLHHGDCLEVMAELPDASVDMILCDLPYGTTACKWDTVIPFEPLWAHYKRVTKPNAAIVLTASQPFTSALVMSNPKWFRHEWIWEKNIGSNFGSVRYAPMKEHESVIVFARKAPSFNPQMQERLTKVNVGKVLRNSTSKSHHPTMTEPGFVRAPVTELRCPRSVQRFDISRWGHRLHPTQKPVALMEYLIRTYTNEGEVVLDNCAGSFTTGVACLNTGRRFIGIERDDGYFRIGSDRMAKRQAELDAAPQELIASAQPRLVA
jgi:site-specific DNA-methyltransferase (adenine-specific)